MFNGFKIEKYIGGHWTFNVNIFTLTPTFCSAIIF